MNFNFTFFINSILLGIGLAMDAFSVSMANGLNDIKMNKRKIILIASVFAFFQFAMPMIGWICLHTIIQYFEAFENFIPWIALILLTFIGIKMMVESTNANKENSNIKKLSFGLLILQGIATSIDAFSVGFTIAEYNLLMAFIASLIIAIVTFLLCIIGVIIGKKFGMHLSNKAQIIGGIILIIIGLEIFIKGII